jgi:penicillin-binding protein 1A
LPSPLRWLSYLLLLLLGLPLFGLALAGIAISFAYPNLPSLESLTDYRPKMPLRVFTADGHLIGEFGEERRQFMRVKDVPNAMKQAILAAEDERFYQHSGVDVMGIARAAVANVTSGGKRQGASTITMQVARNFFLSSEKTLLRKVYEVMLAFKIENNLTKDEILQLYINQIYLGQRAYGFASAAQIYFGKELRELSIAETAMLAGLPKAPSAYNPVANPKRAKLRQLYVLRRMHELGYITDAQLVIAQREHLNIKNSPNDFVAKAEFAAEMARQIAFDRLGESTYTSGASVITTLRLEEQQAAWRSLRKGVMDYDRRHGYRGAAGFVNMAEVTSDDDEDLDELIADYTDSEELLAAIVLSAKPTEVRAFKRGGEVVSIKGEGLKFATKMLDDNAPPNKRLRRGAVIYVTQGEKGWEITQMPEVEAALVAADPKDGAIRALVGGFDFNRNKFNHVTQAWRQPGSSFKPFIYSAALEKGYSPASIVDDSPLVFSSGETGSQAWEPKNYDGKYDGPISLRTALTKSKNMVSIRLLKTIGTEYAQDYLGRFGFEAEKHPPYLTMALGAGSVTPWQMLSAYAIFANGGYRVEPHIVSKIVDERGRLVAQVDPPQAGEEGFRAIDARNAYLMDSIMRDVVRRGTATRAMSLKRTDLAGKTGTTNEYVDAWFCGYQSSVVAVAWIGFDQPRKLGSGETGGAAALPMWIGYMERALAGVPESNREAPEGLALVKSGKDDRPEGDFVYKENQPIPPGTPSTSATSPSLAPASTPVATSGAVTSSVPKPALPSMRLMPTDAGSPAAPKKP